MIISPFVLGIHTPKGIWNNVVTGVPVGLVGILRLSMRQSGWGWFNLILGIRLVISPFVLFRHRGDVEQRDSGIVIAAFAYQYIFDSQHADGV